MRRIKVAAHIHSEWSYDASWTLPRLTAAFGRRGFDAVLMSEHDDEFDARRWRAYQGACAAASTAATLLVPGIEYADEDNVVHIPVWGDVPLLRGADRTDTATLLARARAEAGFAVFAHPWRARAWQRFDESWLPLLSAVEIWNRKYDGWAHRPEALHLARSAGLDPFVSLDFHNRRQFFPLALGVDIDGPLTRAAIQDALHAGRFEPLFMSRSALRFTDGLAHRTMRAIELGRRQAAVLARGSRRRGGGQS